MLPYSRHKMNDKQVNGRYFAESTSSLTGPKTTSSLLGEPSSTNWLKDLIVVSVKFTGPPVQPGLLKLHLQAASRVTVSIE